MCPLLHYDESELSWLMDGFVADAAAVAENIDIGFDPKGGKANMRFEGRCPRMTCHTLSTGLSLGHRSGGKWTMLEARSARQNRAPSSLIADNHGAGAGCDVEDCVFGMPVHRLAVAADPDDAGSLVFSGTDRTEARSQGAPLIARCREASAATCPTPVELGLLSDWGFILPPHLYCGTLG